MSVYIIAEAGASHQGNLSTAVDLIYAAKEAGANCVKFQAWNTDKFVAKTSKFYTEFQALEFSPEHWAWLKAHCDMGAEIDFLCSCFDVETVDMFYDMGMKAFKIASADITYEPLIRHVASKNKPVFLSTGMAEPREISHALGWLGNVPITVLKCTVDYPCAEENVNLAGMETIDDYLNPNRKRYGLRTFDVGLSDHTKGHLAGIMAIALGASVIEKHFAIEETKEAIGVKDFKAWVEKIRQAEKIMGSRELRTFPCEEKWKPIARRGESGLRE